MFSQKVPTGTKTINRALCLGYSALVSILYHYRIFSFCLFFSVSGCCKLYLLYDGGLIGDLNNKYISLSLLCSLFFTF